MNYARTLSSGNIDKYELINEIHFRSSPDRPVHRPTQSLFTTSSGFNNFRGIFTWGCFLLLLTTGRMALENVLKYGIVMDPSAWLRFILSTQDKYLAVGLLLLCNVFILVAWILERLVSRELIPNWLALCLSSCNLLSILAFPTMVIWFHNFDPLFSAPVLSVYTILFLKLWSYVAVNRWCRCAAAESPEDLLNHLLKESTDKHREGHDDTKHHNTDPKKNETTPSELRHRRLASDEVGAKKWGHFIDESEMSAQDRFYATRASVSQVETYRTMLDALEPDPCEANHETREAPMRIHYVTYPDNLTLSHLYYFIFAPTLCYELNFPRTLTIRKPFIFKRLFEVVFINQLILCLAQQWMLPLLKNSVVPFAESNVSEIVERCLKLAIPNHFLWLLFFYSTFHSFLNLIAELTRFGDRLFYSDWWNAETVPAFWSKWNIPVHRFARRHIYLPLISCGLTRAQAGMVVFFVSAILHEFLISVPLKMPRMWAFLVMFSQMPYAMLVHRLFPKGGAWGNVAVWITLIIGQPLALLLYFHDYYLMYYAK